MKELLANKMTLVWLLLCVGTLVSQLLGGSTGEAGENQRAAGTVILVIAFVKAHLVLHYFMGLDRAPVVWRTVFSGWVLLVASLLIALYRLT